MNDLVSTIDIRPQYDKLPKEIDGKKSVPSFDFAHSFRKITGLSVRDFIGCTSPGLTDTPKG